MTPKAIPQASGPYDVVGASEGTDLGNINPDSAAFLIRALAAHVDKISAIVASNKDAPTEQVEFEVDNSNLTAGGQTYHLPSGAAIVSYCIENTSSATVNVFAGMSGAGRSINSVGASAFRVALMPQQVTALTLVPTSTSATGLIRLVLTTVPLAPSIGSSAGAGSSVSVTNFPATQPVSIAAAVPVTGAFWQTTQPVSGTFWQTTQPVSGTFWQATQPVSIATAVATTQQVSNTGTPSTVAVTTTAATALAVNSNRIGGSAYNLPTSASTALLAVGFTASSSSYTVALVPGAYFELPVNFKGLLSTIVASGTASLLMTEYT